MKNKMFAFEVGPAPPKVDPSIANSPAYYMSPDFQCDYRRFDSYNQVPGKYRMDFVEKAIRIADLVYAPCEICATGVICNQYVDPFVPTVCHVCNPVKGPEESGQEIMIRRRSQNAYDAIELASYVSADMSIFENKFDGFLDYAADVLAGINGVPDKYPVKEIPEKIVFKYTYFDVYFPYTQYNDDLLVLFFSTFFVHYGLYKTLPMEKYLDCFSHMLMSDSLADCPRSMYKVVALSRVLPSFGEDKIYELMQTSFSSLFCPDTKIRVDEKLYQVLSAQPGLCLYTEVMEEVFNVPAEVVIYNRDVDMAYIAVTNLGCMEDLVGYPNLHDRTEKIIELIVGDMSITEVPGVVSNASDFSNVNWFNAVVQVEKEYGETYHFVCGPEFGDIRCNENENDLRSRVFLCHQDLPGPLPPYFYEKCKEWAILDGVPYLTDSEYKNKIHYGAYSWPPLPRVHGRMIAFYDKLGILSGFKCSTQFMGGKPVLLHSSGYISPTRYWYWRGVALVKHNEDVFPPRISYRDFCPSIGAWDITKDCHSQQKRVGETCEWETDSADDPYDYSDDEERWDVDLGWHYPS